MFIVCLLFLCLGIFSSNSFAKAKTLPPVRPHRIPRHQQTIHDRTTRRVSRLAPLLRANDPAAQVHTNNDDIRIINTNPTPANTRHLAPRRLFTPGPEAEEPSTPPATLAPNPAFYFAHNDSHDNDIHD